MATLYSEDTMDDASVNLRTTRPTYDQAIKIINRFGGASRLARALHIDRSSVYKWLLPRPYGDGLIPSRVVPRVVDAARVLGIQLTKDDWAPRPIDYSHINPLETLPE